MHFSGSIFPLLILILIASSAAETAPYDAVAQWQWVDTSCLPVIGQVDAAGDDYTALVQAARDSLGENLLCSPLADDTLTAYMGTHDAEGRLLAKKYQDLAAYSAGQHVPYSLYCNGSAFVYVTDWQEDLHGFPFPYEGAWYTRPGRYDASTGPLYIPSTPPQQTSHSICQDSEGAPVRTVTQVGGTAMILCPQAFDSPLAPIPSASTPDVGTALDAYKSLGATMLHEITHMVLRTRDLAYGSAGARLVAKVGGGHKAQSNADSWAFYALACLMEKRAWTEGFAQPVDDYGKEGPTGKRAVEFDV